MSAQETLVILGLFFALVVYGISVIIKIRTLRKDNELPIKELAELMRLEFEKTNDKREENTRALDRLSQLIEQMVREQDKHVSLIERNANNINDNKNEIIRLKSDVVSITTRIDKLEKD